MPVVKYFFHKFHKWELGLGDITVFINIMINPLRTSIAGQVQKDMNDMFFSELMLEGIIDPI